VFDESLRSKWEEECVAHDPDRQVGPWKTQSGGGGLGHALLQHLVELEQVTADFAIEVPTRGDVGRPL